MLPRPPSYTLFPYTTLFRSAVVRRVEVRMIDLIRVARQDDLGAFTRARDDRLDLVRREVLRLVDDHVDVRQRAAADVRQRLDLDEPEIDELGVAAAVLLVGLVETEQQLEVVVDRLHPRAQLLLDVAGEV